MVGAGQTVATFRMSFVKAYKDRHGRMRYYYRRRGFRSVTLKGEPGSVEFAEAYARADRAARRVIGEERTTPGTFGALIADYYQHQKFTDLADKTRATYRGILERFRDTFGDMPVKAMTPKRVDELLASMADRPGARDTLRKVLRIILKLAVRQELITVNPMEGVRLPRAPIMGFRPWTADEMAAFEKRWPSGTRERLAYALMLYTAQRRSDVAPMGRQHVRGDQIHVAQAKSRGRTRLWIPLHAALKLELAHAPATQLTFLQTAYGQPFSAAGFTKWFRDAVKEAGLPDACKPHGLRKAASVMLAEAGCSAKEIMAITGHANLSEVTLYTAGADQEKLAREAMRKVEKANKMTNPKARNGGRGK